MRIALIAALIFALRCAVINAAPQQEPVESSCAFVEYSLISRNRSVYFSIINSEIYYWNRLAGLYEYIKSFFGGSVTEGNDELLIFQDVSCLPRHLGNVIEEYISIGITEYSIIARVADTNLFPRKLYSLGTELDKLNFSFRPGDTITVLNVIYLEDGLILLRRHSDGLIFRGEDVSGVTLVREGRYQLKLSEHAKLVGRCTQIIDSVSSLCHIYFWFAQDGSRVEFQVSLLGNTYLYANKLIQYYKHTIRFR